MSGKIVTRYVMTCDGGCGATFGANCEYPTAAESRNAAAEQGWAVVPKLKSNGKPVRLPATLRGSQYFDDVCPGCLPAFQPRILPERSGSNYIKDLQEENRAMREALRKSGIAI